VVAAVFGDDLWGGSAAKDADAASQTGVPDETITEQLPQPESTPEPSPFDGQQDTGLEPTPVEPDPGATTGDLGLAVPMTAPACDGSWVVFLGAAIDPSRYAADVQVLLDSNPAARYTITQGGCSSMRQQLDDGTLIYAVWTGPYADQAEACAARAGFGDAAYVKRMDNSTPPDQTWQC